MTGHKLRSGINWQEALKQKVIYDLGVLWLITLQ